MLPPRGGGALLRNLSDNYAHSGASLSGQNATENLSAEEQAKAELDANILAGGGLGLDPENDPIVATTDWGLDIRFHNAGEGTYTTNPPADGTVSTTALNGYLYFQGGDYNGVTGLKWVIIGYSTKTVSAGVVSADRTTINPDTTDAGTLIKNYASRGMIYVNSYIIPSYTNAVGNAEIPAGCVLCISEKNLLDTKYQSSYNTDAGDGYWKGARWVYSDLRTTMSNLCEKDIAGFDTIRDKIQEVELNTYSKRRKASDYSDAIAKETSSDKFFALANSTYGTDEAVHYNPTTYPQNYRLETYLGATYASHASKRISYTHNTTYASQWWLRSGFSSAYPFAYYVLTSGCVDRATNFTISCGVRPAFVLQL